MVDGTLSLLVPLLLVVVTQLATVSREVELIEVNDEVDPKVYLFQGGPVDPFIRPLIKISFRVRDAVPGRGETVGDERLEPKFGRFNLIHAISSVLIGLTLVLTALAESSLAGVVLAIVVSVFWMVLPILEVNEYDLMMRRFDRNDPLHSLSVHMFATGILCVPPIAFAYVELAQVPVQLIGAGVFAYMLLVIFVANVFQSHLRDEVYLLWQYDGREQD